MSGTKDRQEEMLKRLAGEIGPAPVVDGPEAFAPKAAKEPTTVARDMVRKLEASAADDRPELSRELASRLMDGANDVADLLDETARDLAAAAAAMRGEGQQIADRLVDYDRRRVAQEEFASAARAWVAEVRRNRP